MELKVSQLIIYPIKSMGGIELSSSTVEARGLQHDRRWMLIDGQGRFISQRESAILALFRINVLQHALRVDQLYDPNEGIEIPFFSTEEVKHLPRINVTIWDDTCEAISYPDEINQWFSHRIDMPCSLVYMPDDSIRKIDPRYAAEGDITGFNDGYPILLVGQASLDDLNSKLDHPIPIQRFRPNVVFTGGTPFQEDRIQRFSINQCEMIGVKLCARCNIPTIDQDTTLANQEPTATLSTYRLIDKKILFGQNVIARSFGEIHVGDALIVADQPNNPE